MTATSLTESVLVNLAPRVSKPVVFTSNGTNTVNDISQGRAVAVNQKSATLAIAGTSTISIRTHPHGSASLAVRQRPHFRSSRLMQDQFLAGRAYFIHSVRQHDRLLRRRLPNDHAQNRESCLNPPRSRPWDLELPSQSHPCPYADANLSPSEDTVLWLFSSGWTLDLGGVTFFNFHHAEGPGN